MLSVSSASGSQAEFYSISLDEFHQIQINVCIDFLSLSALQMLGYYALFCKQQRDVLHNR